MPSALIVVPSLDQPGGVANYYNVLSLDRAPNVRYFEIDAPTSGYFSGLRRLCRIVVRFWFALNGVTTVLLNPSMGRRAVARDCVLAWLTLLRRRRLIVFWRGWDWPFYEIVKASAFWRWLLRSSLTSAHVTITLGQQFENELRSLSRPQSRFVRESTVADDRNLGSKDLAEVVAEKLEAPPVVLFMSRLEPKKGTLTALSAYEIVKKSIPDLRMLVAGDGPDLQAAKHFVEIRGIGDVRFLGHVTGLMKHQALSQATVLLFPTTFGEGLPNVILEAMLYGLPVVSRNNGGIAEVVVHGKNGYLTNSDEPEVFAGFVQAVLEQKDRHREMALANARKARTEFVPDVVRQRMLRLLEV